MDWRPTIAGAVSAILLLTLLFLFDSDPVLSVLFLVTPCVLLATVLSLLFLLYRASRRRSAKSLLAMMVFSCVTFLGMRSENRLRPTLRWAAFSGKIKREVLTQPDQPQNMLKHVEWDGWGGAPVGDWTAYIVFDPANSLDESASGKVAGVPCDVQEVRRLEPKWYSVTLQMNEWWDTCSSGR